MYKQLTSSVVNWLHDGMLQVFHIFRPDYSKRMLDHMNSIIATGKPQKTLAPIPEDVTVENTDPETTGQPDQLAMEEEESVTDDNDPLENTDPKTSGPPDQLSTTRHEPTAGPSTGEFVGQQKEFANKEAQTPTSLEKRKLHKKVQRLLENYKPIDQEYPISAILAYAKSVEEDGKTLGCLKVIRLYYFFLKQKLRVVFRCITLRW